MPYRDPEIPVLKIALCILSAIALIMALIVLWQPFKVWSARLEGEAKYAEAESTRRVAVLDAQAKLDAASKLAEVEVARARGVAQANKIIGDSLAGNEAYLKYLWIQQIEHHDNAVIYVPTEASLPILESGRLGRLPPKAEPTPGQ